MALTPCRECGTAISPEARSCPSCGSPQYRSGHLGHGVASLLIPGLGQAFQGRWGAAAFHFLTAAVLWTVLMGWVVNLASAAGAWMYRQWR
jgi:hypothetical protein